MNIDFLSIAFGATDGSSDNDQLVLGNEVADASLVLAAAGGSGEVEFEGACKLNKNKEKAEDTPQRN
jgi:hypothetical protein